MSSQRFNGWKEIAAYLGRDVTTAIRWEHERGLPVHRVPGGKRSAVYAHPPEIDRWLDSGTLPKATGGVAFERPSARAEPARAVAPSDAEPANGPGAEGNERGSDSNAQGSSVSPRARHRRRAWTALVVVALAGGSAVVVQGLRVTNATAAAGQIDRLEYMDDEIVALGRAGQPLWRHALSAPLDAAQLTANPHYYVIVDLDGDGTRELLVNLPWKSWQGTDYKPRSDELLCLSSRGEVRWRLSLDDQLTFRGRTYEGPWHEGRVVAYRVHGESRIVWAQSHLTWWPSIVVSLDAGGRRLGAFVHSGQIKSLAVVEGPARPLVLAGGVSNAWRAASLAVLDGRGVVGHSPDPPGSAYECVGCGDELPLRYFLFPPSEIVRARGYPYNQLTRIVRVGDTVQVRTHESDDELLAELEFEFSPQMELIHAAAGDNWGTHDRLQAAGALDHSVADCPMYTTQPPVREWTPANGWRDLKLTTTVAPSRR